MKIPKHIPIPGLGVPTHWVYVGQRPPIRGFALWETPAPAYTPNDVGPHTRYKYMFRITQYTCCTTNFLPSHR